MPESKSEPLPNFSIILRAYNGRMTGEVLESDAPLVTSGMRELSGGEAEAAQALLATFAGEADMRRNADDEETP